MANRVSTRLMQFAIIALVVDSYDGASSKLARTFCRSASGNNGAQCGEEGYCRVPNGAAGCDEITINILEKLYQSAVAQFSSRRMRNQHDSPSVVKCKIALANLPPTIDRLYEWRLFPTLWSDPICSVDDLMMAGFDLDSLLGLAKLYLFIPNFARRFPIRASRVQYDSRVQVEGASPILLAALERAAKKDDDKPIAQTLAGTILVEIQTVSPQARPVDRLLYRSMAARLAGLICAHPELLEGAVETWRALNDETRAETVFRAAVYASTGVWPAGSADVDCSWGTGMVQICVLSDGKEAQCVSVEWRDLPLLGQQTAFYACVGAILEGMNAEISEIAASYGLIVDSPSETFDKKTAGAMSAQGCLRLFKTIQLGLSSILRLSPNGHSNCAVKQLSERVATGALDRPLMGLLALSVRIPTILRGTIAIPAAARGRRAMIKALDVEGVSVRTPAAACKEAHALLDLDPSPVTEDTIQLLVACANL